MCMCTRKRLHARVSDHLTTDSYAIVYNFGGLVFKLPICPHTYVHFALIYPSTYVRMYIFGMHKCLYVRMCDN